MLRTKTALDLDSPLLHSSYRLVRRRMLAFCVDCYIAAIDLHTITLTQYLLLHSFHVTVLVRRRILILCVDCYIVTI